MKWLVLLLFFSACTVQHNVEMQIDEANYCETASDCVDIGSKCPYGCNILVNAEEADIMKRKLNALPDTNCALDCISNKEIMCEEKQCVIKE